jgi:hypothetical protein
MNRRNAISEFEALMTDVDRQAHWENVYMTKGEADVSLETPATSIRSN